MSTTADAHEICLFALSSLPLPTSRAPSSVARLRLGRVAATGGEQERRHCTGEEEDATGVNRRRRSTRGFAGSAARQRRRQNTFEATASERVKDLVPSSYRNIWHCWRTVGCASIARTLKMERLESAQSGRSPIFGFQHIRKRNQSTILGKHYFSLTHTYTVSLTPYRELFLTSLVFSKTKKDAVLFLYRVSSI